MAQEFKLPELGENIEAGDVVRVAITPGESVKKGQTVVELETDKAVVEVPAEVDGTVEEVKVANGQRLKVGDVLFTYSAAASAETAAAQSAETTPEPAPAANETAKTKPAKAEKKSAAVGKTELVEFKLPELGENIEAGDVVRVAVKSGDQIVAGQSVIELETDKAVVEVPSSFNGEVKEIKVAVGQRLKVGEVIMTMAAVIAEAEPVEVADAEPEAPVKHAADQDSMAMARHTFRSARTMEGKSEEQALPPDIPSESQLRARAAAETKRGPLKDQRNVPAAPVVRRLAREIGVDIYMVKGSGPGGRISEDDVKAFAKATFARMADPAGNVQVSGSSAGKVVVKLPDFSRWGKIDKQPLRGVRRKTAEHLAVAWNVIPHVTQFDKADVTELEELRKRFAPKAEAAGGKMTMTAIALKVVASALKAFPQFNASIDMSARRSSTRAISTLAWPWTPSADCSSRCCTTWTRRTSSSWRWSYRPSAKRRATKNSPPKTWRAAPSPSPTWAAWAERPSRPSSTTPRWPYWACRARGWSRCGSTASLNRAPCCRFRCRMIIASSTERTRRALCAGL